MEKSFSNSNDLDYYGDTDNSKISKRINLEKLFINNNSINEFRC